MMRPALYVFSFLALLALGFWAYRENYATQAALREVAGLQDEIGALRAALAVQRAEWAYLNRPDRLRELSALNFDRLGLMPMQPAQLGRSSEIAFPQAEFPIAIIDPVDTVGETPADPQEQTP